MTKEYWVIGPRAAATTQTETSPEYTKACKRLDIILRLVTDWRAEQRRYHMSPGELTGDIVPAEDWFWMPPNIGCQPNQQLGFFHIVIFSGLTLNFIPMTDRTILLLPGVGGILFRGAISTSRCCIIITTRESSSAEKCSQIYSLMSLSWGVNFKGEERDLRRRRKMAIHLCMSNKQPLRGVELRKCPLNHTYVLIRQHFQKEREVC